MNKRSFKREPFVIFLMGPTASGKTSLAIQIKKYIPVELISVDSGLIYKYMNIGTAKPSERELSITPHRLINIIDPLEHYTVADFYWNALQEISDIIAIGKIPMLVGGTMLYYQILLNGLACLPKRNVLLRNFFSKQSLEKGNVFLHSKLKKLDPVTANKLHYNDIQRISRALEVCLVTGKPFSTLLKLTHSNFFYKVYKFAIIPPSKMWLHNNIECRFRKMLSLGFKKEVELLINKRGLTLNLPSMHCVGYRQMWLYLYNKITYNEMIHSSITATKQLAKRQMTWLNKWKDLYYLKDNNNESSISFILETIKKELL